MRRANNSESEFYKIAPHEGIINGLCDVSTGLWILVPDRILSIQRIIYSHLSTYNHFIEFVAT